MTDDDGDDATSLPASTAPSVVASRRDSTELHWHQVFRNAVVNSGVGESPITSDLEAAFFRGYESWLGRQLLAEPDVAGASKPPKWALRLYSAFVGLPLIISGDDDDRAEELKVVDCTCRPRPKKWSFCNFVVGITRRA